MCAQRQANKDGEGLENTCRVLLAGLCMPRSRMGRGPESLTAARRYATPATRLAPIGSHLGAPAHGCVGTGSCPPHRCVDDDPSRSMLYDRTAPPLTLGTGIALA